MNPHETYLRRCIDLALQGASYVAPNPMVGAVLVFQDRIIGEGYHMIYGGPHAEVNCIQSVSAADKEYIEESTLYVSLEPCAHFGKTPPCANLIIAHKIPRVVIGCRDPFHSVDGKGIEKLRSAGIETITGELENECVDLNKRFFTYHREHRPYIILKWAETADSKIGNFGNNRLLITNELTNRLVHKWRSEEMAIMVGTNTAMLDNPQLTNRWWSGNNPVRVVIDARLDLPSSLHIFDGNTTAIVFNTLKHDEQSAIKYYQVSEDADMVHQVINGLYQLQIQSIIIEGGAKLLQSFIDDKSWDEARVIAGTIRTASGVNAPVLINAQLQMEEKIGDDVVRYYRRK